jgi:hypothetical protein
VRDALLSGCWWETYDRNAHDSDASHAAERCEFDAAFSAALVAAEAAAARRCCPGATTTSSPTGGRCGGAVPACSWSNTTTSSSAPTSTSGYAPGPAQTLAPARRSSAGSSTQSRPDDPLVQLHRVARRPTAAQPTRLRRTHLRQFQHAGVPPELSAHRAPALAATWAIMRGRRTGVRRSRKGPGCHDIVRPS